MLRLRLDFALTCLIGVILCVAALALAFFASPEAVRSVPPASYNALLLERLLDRSSD